MTVSRTLLQIEDRVTYAADIRGKTGASGRHPMAADIDVEINAAYGRLLTFLVNNNWNFALIETAQAALPTSRADTNEEYSLIDWPVAASLIKRIDVYSGGSWLPEGLDEIDWQAIRNIRGGRSCKHPTHFSAKSSATVSGATVSAGKIALAPFGSSGVYKLTYLPEWTAITNTAHAFIYPDEWAVEWHVQSTVLKVLQRDKDYQKRREDAEREQAKAEKVISAHTLKIVQTGPSQMRRSPNYRSG